MRDFIVEDRKAGEVVLEGKISGAGGVIVSNATSALDEGKIKVIVSQVAKDVAAGKSRGRLSLDQLDWVEVSA
jgi:hypothetical protein